MIDVSITFFDKYNKPVSTIDFVVPTESDMNAIVEAFNKVSKLRFEYVWEWSRDSE